MSIEVNDFIGVMDNALTPEFCDTLIQEYENAVEMGLCQSRQQFEGASKAMKADHAYFVLPTSPPKTPSWKKLGEALYSRVLSEYAAHYGEFFGNDLPIENRDIKIQKTLPKEGYHVWHCEHSWVGEDSKRVLAWLVYLNDVEEGGETEFLYQSMRVKPKKGTAVVFPAAFTHLHRGNPPLSGEKYIVTGWFTYAR